MAMWQLRRIQIQLTSVSGSLFFAIPRAVTLSSESSLKNFFSSYFSTSSASPATRLWPGVYVAPLMVALLAGLFRLIEVASETETGTETETESEGGNKEPRPPRTHSREQPTPPLSSCSAFKASRQPLAWPESRTETLA